MNSSHSEENKSKSNSITSESERQLIRKKVSSFVYPVMPENNEYLRNKSQQLKIATNLYELKFVDERHKLTLFSIEINPTIADDNFLLKRQINNYIESYLPESFKKSFFGGNILLTFINDEKNENIKKIELKVNIKDIEYNIKLIKVKEIELKKVNNFQGYNQRIKTVIEILFRNILMRNPNVIKFKDRTIFEIDPKNISSIMSQGNGNIYRGYMTSANITENGLFMLINNVNKIITGKTALKKMEEIRNRLKNEKYSIKDIEYKINEYFTTHRTVLTTYGSLKPYRIQEIAFDKTPENTKISYFDINKRVINIPLINYYKNQYGIEIKDKNQSLIIAQKNFKNNKNLSELDYIIYLVPELVYITGNEDEDNQNNRRNRDKNIINKTKIDPTKKMEAINSIFNLYKSNRHKKIKKRSGQEIELKSPQELIKEWGINLGNNLIFDGRIINQPKLYYKNNEINPINGLFRSNKPVSSNEITNNNIFFIYDSNEKINHKELLISILRKCQEKGFKFGKNFDPKLIKGYSIDNTNSWGNIYEKLRSINLNDGYQKKIGIIFASPQLEKYYDKLKNYFLKQCKIPTQHIITRNIDESRKKIRTVNSIQYNIVDQMNIKMGGMNYYIDFKESKIIQQSDIFLIIGLDSKYVKKKTTYSMTSTKHPKLNVFITQEETCNNSIKEEKNNTLKKMFRNAIEELKKAKCPKSPDYIILYRQGGNEIHNKRLTVNELDNFIEVLNELKEKNKDDNNFNYKNTKFYYICCNLKSNLKFFEVNENTNINTNMNTYTYKNPKSGLIVDDNVTQKDKYEFYIQPQFVNQGTATPCHYQVMYYDKDPDKEKDLKKENLEKLSFYLSFYYWTWSGAIRTPAMLKMSSTALDFYFKCLYDDENGYFFDVPYYI